MEIISEPKLNLILKADRELRLYLMIAKKPDDEKVVVIGSYDLENALIKARETNVGYLIRYNGQNILFKDLLATIETGGIVAPQTENSKESFINNLMLSVDRFVESENDKKSIKRILGKIK